MTDKRDSAVVPLDNRSPTPEPAEKEINMSAEQKQEASIDVDRVSGFRLRDRWLPEKSLVKLARSTKFVPIQQLSQHVAQWRSVRISAKPSDDWATAGVVDRVITDRDVATLRLCDMRGNRFHVFFTKQALRSIPQDRLVVGAVLGVHYSTIVWSKELGAPPALQIKKRQQLWEIGTSFDMVQCVGYIKKSKQCPTMIDRRAGEYCNLHMMRLFSSSRNGRMELASSDSKLDIRWATRLQNKDGSIQYQDASTGTNEQDSKEYTYTVQPYGPVTADGKMLQKKPVKDPKKEEQNREQVSKFLQGRTDTGALLLRKLHGIKNEQDTQAKGLSREAMERMGLDTRQLLTKEEQSAKAESIKRLRQTQATKNEQKKPRYVYL